MDEVDIDEGCQKYLDESKFYQENSIDVQFDVSCP
jgi:hypothetical protein